MAVVFPTDSEFIALTRDGVPYSNTTVVSPSYTDIVGTADFPAIYFATDDTYSFYRFRLRNSPLAGGCFFNSFWSILFDIGDTLDDSYEWKLALDGGSCELFFKQNTVKFSPGPGFNDQAEGLAIPFPITPYDIARAVSAGSTLGGGTNYFLDFAIPRSFLYSTLGITDSTPLRFNYVTSANENNFNKDKNCPDSDFDACFSDPVSLETVIKGKIVNKEDGSPICDALVEIFDNNSLLYTTTTDMLGNYLFMLSDGGTYTIKITKCCFLSNCGCNIVTIKKNTNNMFNFALAPDCICSIKCLIGETEKELIEEKQRIYNKITSFFSTSIPTQQILSRYISLLCLLNKSTADLDCCISCVLENLDTCEGSECDE
ncbi:MAG: carboxypeptidase-like regulatory domain-containing protein [Clostridiaceae bacterium]